MPPFVGVEIIHLLNVQPRWIIPIIFGSNLYVIRVVVITSIYWSKNPSFGVYVFFTSPEGTVSKEVCQVRA